MTRLSYVIRRLLHLLPVLLLAAVAVFALMRAVPGDPALMYAGTDASPEQLQAVRHEFGLDQNPAVQFGKWAGQVLHGNLGKSFASQFPVSTLVMEALPATMELTLAATFLALLIGIPTGVFSAARQRSWLDGLLTGINSVILGIPNFWTGILLIILFALVLGWLPSSGRVGLFDHPAVAWKYLLMPAFTLAFQVGAQLAVFTRAALIDVLQENYVRTARAKGIAESTVLMGHALKNALIPVVTLMSVQFTRMLGGAIVVESVFGWPGVGRLVVQAINGRDYPVVQGVLLIFVAISLIVNLLTDLSYGAIDPRVRLGRRTGGA